MDLAIDASIAIKQRRGAEKMDNKLKGFKRYVHDKSKISRRIKFLMKVSNKTEEDIVREIRRRASNEVKKVCIIDIHRMLEITSGSSPTFIESLLIVQALGKTLGDLTYQIGV